VCVTGLTVGGATEKYSRPAQSVGPYCWVGLVLFVVGVE
jgi:hypothetical protein